MEWWNLILILVGLILLAGSVLNWGWIIRGYRGMFLTRLVGESATRIIYFAIGITILMLGILGLANVIG